MWTKVFCVYFDEFVVRGNGFTHRYFATHIHQMIMIKNGVLAAECYRWTHPFLCHAHQMWIFHTQKRIFHWNEVQSDLVVFIAFLPHPRDDCASTGLPGVKPRWQSQNAQKMASLYFTGTIFFFSSPNFSACVLSMIWMIQHMCLDVQLYIELEQLYRFNKGSIVSMITTEKPLSLAEKNSCSNMP